MSVKRRNLPVSLLWRLVFLISTIHLHAQDTIVFVNGTKHPVKIIEVTEKKVKYKNPKDTAGPTYVIMRRDVERFIRTAGCIEIADKGYVDCVRDPNYYVIKNENFTRRIVSVDLARFAVMRVKLSFEYVTPNRKIGFGGYYERGLRDFADKDAYVRQYYRYKEAEYTDRNKFDGGFYKVNSLGAELKLYPFAHKKLVYWLGFILEGGQCGNMVAEEKHTKGYNVVHYVAYNYAMTSHDNYFYTTTGTYFFYKELYAAGFFSNGLIYRPVKHIAIQSYFSFGANAIHLKEENKMVSTFALTGGVKFGYAF
jgi:hypothetical protein